MQSSCIQILRDQLKKRQQDLASFYSVSSSVGCINSAVESFEYLNRTHNTLDRIHRVMAASNQGECK